MAHDEGLAAEQEPRVSLIVDGANVIGSRADGWWRDRAAAMVRLHDELAGLAGRGVSQPGVSAEGAVTPAGSAVSRGFAVSAGYPGSTAGSGPWFPEIVLVVEGKAREAVGRLPRDSPVRVVAAAGSGDDEIARLAGSLPGRRIVVTADQGLRRRCVAAGAEVTGPRWLLERLSP